MGPPRGWVGMVNGGRFLTSRVRYNRPAEPPDLGTFGKQKRKTGREGLGPGARIGSAPPRSMLCCQVGLHPASRASSDSTNSSDCSVRGRIYSITQDRVSVKAQLQTPVATFRWKVLRVYPWRVPPLRTLETSLRAASSCGEAIPNWSAGDCFTSFAMTSFLVAALAELDKWRPYNRRVEVGGASLCLRWQVCHPCLEKVPVRAKGEGAWAPISFSPR